MRIAAALAFLASSWCLAATPLQSGIDLQYMDKSVRPQDDLFRYLSGKWLDTAPIPADRARYGSFDALGDATELQLKDIVEGLAHADNLAAGSDERKIADLYNSFMDEPLAETRGLSGLQGELARIDALADKRELPALIGHLSALGVHLPIGFEIDQDARASTRYAVYLNQGGLGLPDRDYYLKDDDARLKGMRDAYRAHVQRTLTMAGLPDTEQATAGILALETELARAQWTKVENRDPVKTYNKTAIAQLDGVVPGFDWPAYFAATQVGSKVDYVIVRQPSFFTGFAKLLDSEPLATWKTYLKWHLLRSYAPYLDKVFVEKNFDFYGKALRGIPEDQPRWKRGIALVDGGIGEALGRSYVAKYFPPQNKARMQALVANLVTAYRQSIAKLDWMSAETKKQALAKLAKLTPKIGYPDRWRDYGKLEIDRNDLVGNVMRARQFEFARDVNKLGRPIDRSEWLMTPQTVNAYYNPAMNEVVFPAAILQPPFFNVAADDAVNYGGIGAVIGHEISHGFDDEGSQYDDDGNLRDWWTKADHAKFDARTKVLVAQYSAFSPVPGYNVNGELTLGENIADNSGLAIAYKAYRISLAGKPAPVIDGLTGDQRFCLGFAQVWRGKARDAEAIRLIKIDPHSPPQFRADGTLRNLPAFYSAFGVKAGDKMYLPPAERVKIW
ncbi:MAG TPA: M13-type metalloendopeptidase [Rhodocyclaceae bacterium]|nr:M13-type metalloendopeptidase [Rhodocyclaceae bacterium]